MQWFSTPVEGPYKLTKIALSGNTIDDTGSEPMWSVDLPFTQCGPPYEHDGFIWVPMCDLTQAFASSTTTPRDKITSLKFAKIQENPDGTSAEIIETITATMPVLTYEWNKNFLYPKSRMYPGQMCTTRSEGIEQWNLWDWPGWGDIANSSGYLGDSYPVTYGKVDNGGHLAGIIWTVVNNLLFAIPKWSHSPQIIFIDPTNGNVVVGILDGSADYNRDGDSVYELYTTIMTAEDKLLIHFERFEWDAINYNSVFEEDEHNFEGVYHCRAVNTVTDTGTGDGTTKLFVLSTSDDIDIWQQYNSTSDFYFPETSGASGIIVDGNFYVTINDVYTDEYSMQRSGGQVRVNFSTAPQAGANIKVYYRPGFVNYSSGWRATCPWGADSQQIFDASARQNCFLNTRLTSGDCWLAAYMRPNDYNSFSFNGVYGFLTDGCNTCITWDAYDPSPVLAAHEAIGTTVDGLLTSYTLSTPVSWKHGYRLYNLLTGEQEKEIYVEDRECAWNDVKKWNFRQVEDSFVVEAPCGLYPDTLPANFDYSLGPNEDVYLSTKVGTMVASGAYGTGCEGCTIGGNVCDPVSCGAIDTSAFKWYSQDGAEVFTNSCVEGGGNYVGANGYGGFPTTVTCGDCVAALPGDSLGNTYNCGHVNVTYFGFSHALVYDLVDLPGEMSKKTPWLTWNAGTDGTNIYFGPGRVIAGVPFPANTSTGF